MTTFALLPDAAEPLDHGTAEMAFNDILDGSVSQLWDPTSGRRDQTIPLGPIVVALQSG